MVPWIACGSSENMKGSAITEESIFWEPLFCLTSVETDMLAFVWLRGERANRTEGDAMWGESLAGQPAPAKQRIYCHGMVSSPQSVWHTYPLWRTDIADSSEPLKLLPKPLSPARQLSTPPSFLLRQRWAHIRLTIRLELRACIKLAHIHVGRHAWCVPDTSHGSQTMSLHWHSLLSYLSVGRLEKGGLPCCLFPLFLSFSQCHALTFQRLSMRPFSHSLDLESFIYLGYQQRQTTGTASVSLLLIEVPLSAYCYGSNIWSRQSEEEHNGGGKEGVQEIVGAAVVKTRQ